jgi:RNA polymerase sigma factor (sigma-70 family)
MATIAPEVPVLARDEAFEQLYRQYVKDVYHYALALLRNPADAEDVTQTTFMNAYRAFKRGEEILKPQNWLIKIAHNVARSRYSRMSRRVKEVPLDDHVEHLASAENDRPNVEGVLRALGRLPFNQRAALIMRELEGRSYAEIADTLGVSVAAVETLIFRARRSLRVRAAALKTIAAVPLPTSLTQFFGGGAAVAGGVGAGFVFKAAVALVAGALATGLGGDRGTPAGAAPASSTDHVATNVREGARAAGERLALQTRAARAHAAIRASRADRLGRVSATHPSQETPAPTAAAAASSSQPASASSLPAATATATAAVQDTVDSTVDSTVNTLEEAVAGVTAPLPVNPPPLPVEPPPLPKLP